MRLLFIIAVALILAGLLRVFWLLLASSHKWLAAPTAVAIVIFGAILLEHLQRLLKDRK